MAADVVWQEKADCRTLLLMLESQRMLQQALNRRFACWCTVVEELWLSRVSSNEQNILLLRKPASNIVKVFTSLSQTNA